MKTDKLTSKSLHIKTCHGDRIIIVTEWANGEGYDISVDDKSFQITQEEMSAVISIVTGFYVTEEDE